MLESDMLGPVPIPGIPLTVTEVTLSERHCLRLSTKQPLDLDHALELALRIEDLLLLLTDASPGFGFPILRLGEDSLATQVYYQRVQGPRERIEPHKSWVPFRAIATRFGAIAESWIAKHESFGPGFHLYLGTRRTSQLYIEHRFASLVWGLESLHRRKSPPQEKKALRQKIDRILLEISRTKDREWAERQFEQAGEPTLASRLSAVFCELLLPVDRKELDEFTQRCAKRRNDISHYGGMREPGSYDEFLAELVRLSGALDLLYHAKLLQEIEIPDEQIHWWFLEGPRSYWILTQMKEAGLTLRPNP